MTSEGRDERSDERPSEKASGERSDPRASDRTSEPTQGRLRGRRRFLAGLGTVGIGGLAGCSGLLGEDGSDGSGDGSGNETTAGEAGFGEFRGSGPLAEDREELQGTRIADLPDLSGELTIYLGGGEGGLYRDLLARFQEIYPDFTVNPRESGTADAANTIISEGDATPADVFWSVDAGSLSAVANEGLTATLPSEVVDPVPEEFHPDDAWVGTAGRARAVPYNTNELSADDVPDTVMDFPETEGMASAMGWAPTYGAFQAFVTAMRLIEGEDATRQWLQDMVDAGVSEYNNEFLVSNAVADGELTAGFANHYYALRVQASRPDAPLDLAFTSGDAGALINVAGAAVLGASENTDLANTFLRHLLSAEAQEFFATRTYAYPMVEGIPPVGGLPSIDELNPPELDLSKLSDLQPTLELMREVGVL
jgi:iron(III) transport system substrate-binding protein